MTNSTFYGNYTRLTYQVKIIHKIPCIPWFKKLKKSIFIIMPNIFRITKTLQNHWQIIFLGNVSEILFTQYQSATASYIICCEVASNTRCYSVHICSASVKICIFPLLTAKATKAWDIKQALYISNSSFNCT